jgi:hypothetical protein
MQNGLALAHADLVLRGDRQIVEAAVQQSREAIVYADPSLKAALSHFLS